MSTRRSEIDHNTNPAQRFAPLARVERSGRGESWHLGAVAAVTPRGQLVASLGDPGLATYLRSVAKPLQAVPLIEAGGVEAFDLDASDVALICASHSATPEHVERVESLLERGGFGPEDLQCGSHWPYDKATREAMQEHGETPTALHNNCSGKHAGMLLACRLLELPSENYLDPDHELQRRILEVVAQLSGLAPEAIGIGVDGCGAPCFYLPLEAAGRAYAALAQPSAGEWPRARREALDAIVAAMTSRSEMVTGPGEFSTRLMQVSGGRLLAKEGAEGLFGVAALGPAALGVVLKIADGSARCRSGAVLEILRQLGLLSSDEMEQLLEFYGVPLTNRSGMAVGKLVPELELVQK